MAAPFFDTHVLVDWLTGHAAARAELARYGAHRISRLVWTQLLAAEPLERRAAVQDLLARFEVVELDQRIAAAAADLAHRMEIGLIDAVLLATAQVNGAILVSRNPAFPAAMPGIRRPYSLQESD